MFHSLNWFGRVLCWRSRFSIWNVYERDSASFTVPNLLAMHSISGILILIILSRQHDCTCTFSHLIVAMEIVVDSVIQQILIREWAQLKFVCYFINKYFKFINEDFQMNMISKWLYSCPVLHTSTRTLDSKSFHFSRSSNWRTISDSEKRQLELEFGDDGEFWYDEVAVLILVYNSSFL